MNVISMYFDGLSDTIPALKFLQVSLGLFVKPKINSGVKSLQLRIIRNSYEYAVGTLSITVLPNSLKSVLITPSNLIVSQITSYTFVVLTNN